VGGGGFGGIVDDCSRPTVQHWTGVAFDVLHLSAPDLRDIEVGRHR
jgi:hypothetical protein